MKIGKKLIVILLALVLGIVSFVPATFSWYDHDGSLSGDRLSYTRETLPVSAGEVSIDTKKFKMDRDKLYYDDKGNKEYDNQEDDNQLNSDSVAAGKTQYYGTVITNTGTADAYVNLYLNGITNSTKNYIGTLQPSLTEKGFSSTVHLKNKNKVRVYFQWDKAANAWNAAGARTYVVSTSANGTVAVTQFDTTNNKLENKAALSNVTTYYADLIDGAVSFYFATDAGTTSNINMTTGEVTQAWYRTKTITNVQAETGYYLTGSTDDTTWNAQYTSFSVPGGVSVMTYFDTVQINAGQHAYITLNKGTNFTGESVSYSVTSGSNVTVNGNTGFITAASDLGVDENAVATITTTITGSLGDVTTVESNVVNPQKLNSAAIALNVRVPGRTADENGDMVDGTTEVVWYIKNKISNQACEFESIYYTK